MAGALKGPAETRGEETNLEEYDSRESQTMASTVSTDTHLEWNHGKHDGDKTLAKLDQ